MRFAAVLKNAGKMSRLGGEASPMPVVLRAGAAFSPEKLFLGARWLLAADASYIRGGEWHTSWGLEMWPLPLLALRAGYQTGFETRGFQYGFGLQSKRFALDYGLTPFHQELGLGQKLSFSFLW